MLDNFSLVTHPKVWKQVEEGEEERGGEVYGVDIYSASFLKSSAA